MAFSLFRGHHDWRTLSVSNKPFACDEDCADGLAVDDDGSMARHKFCRRISRRLSRHVLVKHGERRFLPNARPDIDDGRYRNHAPASTTSFRASGLAYG